MSQLFEKPKHRIFFDIESGCLDEKKLLKQFEPTFEPDKRLKDADKILADLEDKKLKWIESAGLKAEMGQILCIGYCYDKEPVQILHGGKDEKKALELFRDILQVASLAMTTVCGFCMKQFDLPYFRRRCLIHGIDLPFYNHADRYNPFTLKLYDAFEDWQSGNRQDSISLDRLSRAFGGRGKMPDATGKDFAKLWISDRKKALEYVTWDVEETRFVVEKMNP